MGKQSISRTETEVFAGENRGKQLNQTIMVDDNALPSPQDLEAYKQIDPNIITCIINATIKEQEHRHYIEKSKMELLKNAERKTSRLNWWGMFFAFLSLVIIAFLTFGALYLNKPWFAGIFGGLSTFSIITAFLNINNKNEKERDKND